MLTPEMLSSLLANVSEIIGDLPEEDLLALYENPDKLKSMLANFAKQVQSDEELVDFPHDYAHMVESDPYKSALDWARDMGDFSLLDTFGPDTLRSLALNTYDRYKYLCNFGN